MDECWSCRPRTCCDGFWGPLRCGIGRVRCERGLPSSPAGHNALPDKGLRGPTVGSTISPSPLGPAPVPSFQHRQGTPRKETNARYGNCLEPLEEPEGGTGPSHDTDRFTPVRRRDIRRASPCIHGNAPPEKPALSSPHSARPLFSSDDAAHGSRPLHFPHFSLSFFFFMLDSDLLLYNNFLGRHTVAELLLLALERTRAQGSRDGGLAVLSMLTPPHLRLVDLLLEKRGR